MENSVTARFERKFIPEPNTGCYLWTAAVNPRGYGHFCVNGVVRDAHRVAYELYVGQIPPRMCVLHRCDVPGCVRPDHLFLGTQPDNLKDMTAKGRRSAARGEKHSSAKLTVEQVNAIRADQRTHREIAKDYAIGKSTVGNIKQGVTWRT
jgi:hypothetical protein